MAEFFRGWKRKVGCVTLLMALMLVAGWVRSEAIRDFIMLDLNKSDGNWDWVYSNRQRLFWQRTYDDPDYTRRMPYFKMQSLGIPHRSNLDDHQNSMDYLYRKRFFGFELAWFSTYGSITQPYSRVIAVPYWSITIPLTSLSAWLLLSRSRKSTQNKIDRSDAVEGA